MVHVVQAAGIHLEQGQGLIGQFPGDDPVGAHLGVVAHPAQQAVGDPRGAAGAAGDLLGPRVLQDDPQDPCRAADDGGQVLHPVELQALDDAEAVAQGRGEQPGPGGGPHQGEGRQVQLDGARRRALADHDVELVVLHGRVEDLLHHRPQAVDLVHEEDIARFQVGEQGGQVAGPLQDRPRGLAQVDTHLRGDDVGQGGLTQARGAEQQAVVQGLAAGAGGGDEDLHLLAHRRLALVLIQAARAHRPVEAVIEAGSGVHQAFGVIHGRAERWRAARMSSSLAWPGEATARTIRWASAGL